MGDYLISYVRYNNYKDGSIDRLIVVGEEKSDESLDEVLNNIDNNEKYLNYRQSDLLDQNPEKKSWDEIEEEGIYWVIQDSEGKILNNTPHLTQGYRTVVAARLDSLTDDGVRNIGEDLERTVTEDGIFQDPEILKLLLVSRFCEMFSIKDSAIEFGLKGTDNQPMFHFRSELPFFAFNGSFLTIAERYSLDLTVVELVGDLCQLYSSEGELDEGGVIRNGDTHPDNYADGEYLKTDYIDDLRELFTD